MAKTHNTRRKTCGASGCDTRIPPAMWFCDHHWTMLRPDQRENMQNAIKASIEADYDTPSDYRPFMFHFHTAIAYLAEIENRVYARATHAKLADVYARPMTSYPGDG